MSKKGKLIGAKVILGVIGGFFAAGIAGTAYLTGTAAKKVKQHESGNNLMQSVFLGKKCIDINPDTDRAYINCVAGVTEIVVNELPANKDMYIELGSACSVLAIRLPENAKVSLEGTGRQNVVNNMFDAKDDETLPTIHITLSSTCFSAVNIVKNNPQRTYIELD